VDNDAALDAEFVKHRPDLTLAISSKFQGADATAVGHGLVDTEGDDQDGTDGWPSSSPHDASLVSCGLQLGTSPGRVVGQGCLENRTLLALDIGSRFMN
jgi:hypothetical protein